MSFLLEAIIRSSIVLASAWPRSGCCESSRPRCATGCLRRRWRLAAAQPVINRIVPALPIPGDRLGQRKRSRREPVVETDISR